MPKRGVKIEEWEVREGFVNSEAVFGRCSSGFDEEGHRVELEFCSGEKSDVGGKTSLEYVVEGDEGFQWRKAEQQERVRQKT